MLFCLSNEVTLFFSLCSLRFHEQEEIRSVQVDMLPSGTVHLQLVLDLNRNSSNCCPLSRLECEGELRGGRSKASTKCSWRVLLDSSTFLWRRSTEARKAVLKELWNLWQKLPSLCTKVSVCSNWMTAYSFMSFFTCLKWSAFQLWKCLNLFTSSYYAYYSICSTVYGTEQYVAYTVCVHPSIQCLVILEIFEMVKILFQCFYALIVIPMHV